MGRQGVLLLNTTLTVRAGRPASHQEHGWETFTDEVIRVGRAKTDPVVFILWGSYARRKKELDRHDTAHDHRVAAPVAAVGQQRVLRQQAVQPANEALPRWDAPVDWDLTGVAATMDQTVADALDDQRRVIELRSPHHSIDVVVEMLDGWRRHLSGRNASLLAFFGFLSIFPLLLAATTILGFVLEGNAELQQDIVDGAFAEIPVLGDAAAGDPASLDGNIWVLLIGLGGALWASTKAFVGLQRRTRRRLGGRRSTIARRCRCCGARRLSASRSSALAQSSR